MPPHDAELAGLVDAVLAARPAVDTSRLTAALQGLCAARDHMQDPERRERLNLLITLVMAVKHPIGAPPWDALAEAHGKVKARGAAP